MGLFDVFKKKAVNEPASTPVNEAKPAYDKAKIEEFKAQLNKAKDEQGDWKTPYTELMRAVYAQPVLFFALSREKYDPKSATSTPLISTKDFGGVPALYVFTDVETATGWMQHYRFVSEDMKYGLIGAIRKDDFNFHSVFAIARAMGTQMIVLDEGASLVGIRIPEFFEANNIDPTDMAYPISLKEAESLEDMMADDQSLPLEFGRVPAIPLTRA